MTVQPATEIPTIDAQQGGDWDRPLQERQIAMLGRMAEIGLEMALVLERQVKAAEADGTLAEVAGAAMIGYGRVARAVRLTLMLQDKLIRALKERDRFAASDTTFATRGLADERKARVERIVERIAEHQDKDTDEVERLVEEATERLDQDDLYGHVLSRPVSELVAMICQDLDLDPDWPNLAQEAWAREEMAGDRPGWPLAGMADRSDAAPIRLRRRGSSP